MKESKLDYAIGAYPITCLQYGSFVRSRGYFQETFFEKGRLRWGWTAAGWKWKELGRITGPREYREVFQTPNHPVVGISFYEAVAYTQWLTVVLHEKKLLHPEYEIALPTGGEWLAAAGADQSGYQWGSAEDDETISKHCNWSRSKIGATCSVGMFPIVSEICGAYDMTGNVLEWTLEHYKNGDEGCTDPGGNDARVLRGGSWYDGVYPDNLRSSRRLGGAPGGRLNCLGFRVVVRRVSTP